MISGMLWFDNSNAPLAQKIRNAVAYFEKKYGRKPNLCLVHPGVLDSDDSAGAGLPDPVVGEAAPVAVRPYRVVLPGHLWIGIEEIVVRTTEEENDENRP